MSHLQEITTLILSIADEFNDQLENKIEVVKREEAFLYGKHGVLDSLGLVSLIVAIEQAIEDEMGITLTIADEKAMSQKHSPFRTIGTLATYIDTLINESQEK